MKGIGFATRPMETKDFLMNMKIYSGCMMRTSATG